MRVAGIFNSIIMHLSDVAKEAFKMNQAKGYHADHPNPDIPKLLCLIHSEVSEALEAHRTGNNCLYNINTLPDKHFEPLVKHTFEDELADIIIRTCDLAQSRCIDIDAHVQAKLRYNAITDRDAQKAY